VKLLKDCFPVLFNEAPSWKVTLLSLWPTIIGHISDTVVLESIQGATLIVSVKGSAWLHEINCLKPVIIEKVNQALSGTYITDIRFKNRNSVTQKRDIQVKRNTFKEASLQPLSLPQEIALKRVEDVELKKQLKRFLCRCINQAEREKVS
jgi:hypothetical protein